jgi:hypothetical protein
VSEPAGALACALLLGDARAAAREAARLSARVRRLVAPCGAFAQLSAGYHRLLLDVLAVTAWLCCRIASPFLDDGAQGAGAAAVVWLRRVADPSTGARAAVGHEDGSAFADLSLAGPADARPCLERAARLLAGRSAGFADDPAALGWACRRAPPLPAAPPDWEGEACGAGAGRAARGRCSARGRCASARHADLLHLDLGTAR